MTRVDVLYIDDCPHVNATADRVRAVASHLGLEIDLKLVRVATFEDAQRIRFMGSPTVRVEGVDIDPSASTQSNFGVCCRTYDGAGVPPETMIAAALGKHV